MTITIDPKNVQEGLIALYVSGLILVTILFAIAYPSLKKRSSKK